MEKRLMKLNRKRKIPGNRSTKNILPGPQMNKKQTNNVTEKMCFRRGVRIRLPTSFPFEGNTHLDG